MQTRTTYARQRTRFARFAVALLASSFLFATAVAHADYFGGASWSAPAVTAALST